MIIATAYGVILGLDPSIHSSASAVDPRVKPEGDEG